MLAERTTLVKLDDVSLKLTLSDKLLRKPFSQAVLSPFLKAYAKRTGNTATLEQVSCVKVDGVMLGDLSIAAEIVLLTTEAVDTEIFMRGIAVPPKPAFEYNPFGAVSDGPSARVPPGTSLKDFDEGGRSEVERLKEARRAAREAREAADLPTVDVCVGDSVVVCGLQSAVGRTMNGLQGVVVGWVGDKQRWELQLDSHTPGKTVNVKPENTRPLAVPATSSATPATLLAAPCCSDAGSSSAPPGSEAGAAEAGAVLEALPAAEDETLAIEAGALRAAFANVDYEDVEAVDELEELSQRVAALRGRLAARQAALDEIDLSALKDEAREAARGRRKAACARLETLLPDVHALCGEILAARKLLAC